VLYYWLGLDSAKLAFRQKLFAADLCRRFVMYWPFAFSIVGRGRAQTVGWDKEASCVSRTPLNGRASVWAQIGDKGNKTLHLRSRNENPKVKTALGQLPSA